MYISTIIGVTPLLWHQYKTHNCNAMLNLDAKQQNTVLGAIYRTKYRYCYNCHKSMHAEKWREINNQSMGDKCSCAFKC